MKKRFYHLYQVKEYKGFVESIIKEQWLIEPEQLKENGKNYTIVQKA